MKSRSAALAVLGAAGLTLFAIFLTGGSLAAAVAPAFLLVVLYLAFRAPLRTCVAALMFFALIADAPQDNPMAGLWHSPLYGIGQLLCNNWSNTFGISALSFSGLDFFTVLLFARAAFDGGAAPTASALRSALARFFAAVIGLGFWGVASGGSVGSAYWQVRQFVFIPVFAWLLTEALRSDDHLLLGRIVVAAALVKTSVGLFFHFAIAGPRGLHPPFLTTHSDTMLFCLAITIVFVRFLEQPDLRSLRRCLWIIPLVLSAVWLNNRRVAWVGLFGAFLAVWQLSPRSRVKRKLVLVGLFSLPFAALYLAAGWGSSAPAFKPVASIRTLVATKDGTRASDSSTLSRQIENFNLAQTMRRHPLGTGLGQPYDEVVKGPDISKSFALYRYIPHNSVLWLMTAGGPLGFFLLWSLFVVGIYLAARAYRSATLPTERMAALSALCAQLLFLVQAWGDMGTQNWSTTWLVAAALAVSGRLAVDTGAWPSVRSTTAAPYPAVC